MRKINEAQINPSDVKAIFKTAVDHRANPTGFSRLLKKDKIDINDLQSAWKEDGFSDDTRDIERILKDAGFSQKEINKVFAEIFGKEDSGEYTKPAASDAILKIAQYAKETGIDKELISFLQKEYGFKESTVFDGKLMIEDIRRIFTRIVSEERSDLITLRKEYEHTAFGRNKK